MAVEITVGQWLVWNAWGVKPRYEAAEVVKITAKTVTHSGLWGRETRRTISGDEVWCGPEADAKALVKRLNSSSSLMADEQRRSRERHNERVQKLIAFSANPDRSER